MSAAVHFALGFHPVTDDSASTMQAKGSEFRDGTFKAVEGVFLAFQSDRKRFVVIVSAGFAFHG
jgi:hypothetical protein